MSSLSLPEFTIPGAMAWTERRVHVEHAMGRGLPRLTMRPAKDGYLTIACYGPSLKDTWRDMRQPILSVSGAHDFLIGKGIVPAYHVECDPRAHKAKMFTHANDTTEYLIASCCHPDVFEALQARRVLLWHLDNGEESRVHALQHDPEALCISGGSTVGLRAFELAHVLGYRALDVHGMDCSFAGSAQWAGPHTGTPKAVEYIRLAGNNRTFATSALMVQAAREAVNFWRTHDCPMKVRGSGLMQAMLKKTMAGYVRPPAPKPVPAPLPFGFDALPQLRGN